MKKRQFKIILIVISLIFLFYMIATTFSKFISTSNGNGILGVAKWHVKVGNVDVSSNGNHDISTEIEMTPEANAAIAEGKIAPRSKFTGSFTIDPCDTEVNIEYTIKIGDFQYSGEATPDFKLEKVTIDGAEVVLDENNTYTGTIEINDPEYVYKKIEVVIYGVWNPQSYDNLTGIETGNLIAPINVTVEQSAVQ